MSSSLNFIIIVCVLCSFDLSTYFLLKNISKNKISLFKGIPIASALYVFQSLTILTALNIGNSVAILNLAWNCLSNIAVTLFGVFYLKENISGLKLYGVICAIISIFLISLDGYLNL